MKVKVLENFIDVHTREPHQIGEVFECTKERIEEINKVNKNLVKVLKGRVNVCKK